MNSLIFSVAKRNEDTEANRAKALHYLTDRLAEFNRRQQTQVQLEPFTGEKFWPALQKAALTKSDFDVSQMGTTWVEGFARMMALRPFSAREVAHIGGAENYLPSVWKTATVLNDSRIWAIPWMTDLRFIYYWRDMLDAAGIDEKTAFETVEKMENTLERLRAGGMAAPWAGTTARTNNTLLYVASWIWGMGGDFVTADGKSTAFCEPAALAGITAYHRLLRYMPHQDRPLSEQQVLNLFTNRQTAAALFSRWMPPLLADSANRDHLGVALPPGPPFVGGSNLAIFQHIPPRIEHTALALIEFLMSSDIQREYSQLFGMLPARLDVLSEPPFSTDPYYQVFVEGSKRGRALPTISMWGMVEENLHTAFETIWVQALTNRTRPVADIVIAQLEPCARRLDKILSQV